MRDVLAGREAPQQDARFLNRKFVDECNTKTVNEADKPSLSDSVVGVAEDPKQMLLRGLDALEGQAIARLLAVREMRELITSLNYPEARVALKMCRLNERWEQMR